MSNTEIVARRTTFDGVQINLHADGSLSTRMHFVGRSRLPLATMWREIEDISIFTYAELPDFIRDSKSGKRQKERDRIDYVRSGRAAEQADINSRERMRAARERIETRRAQGW